MQLVQEAIPFARELMEQGCSNRRLIKIYALGSGLAMCGLVGGLVDATSFVFGDKDILTMETDISAVSEKVSVPEKVPEKEVQLERATTEEQMEEVVEAPPADTTVRADDVFDGEEMYAKAKQNPAITQRRRSRSFAS